MKTVYVDVYSWVVALEGNPNAMNGLFRHAYALGLAFNPAVIIPEDENAPNRGLERLAAILAKPVKRFTHADQLDGKIWLSLGVDQICSTIIPVCATRCTILHDALSAGGYFGVEAEERYFDGAIFNDVFLYTTTYALTAFKEWAKQKGVDISFKTFIPYGCFHWLADLPYSNGRTSNMSLSVHTLFNRKRLEQSLELAKQLRTHHIHIGAPADPIVLVKAQDYQYDWVRDCDDSRLIAHYKQAEHFICMSSAEGFSMPPLEAILLGVQYIHLSDIPAHEEVYGQYQDINFYSEPRVHFRVRAIQEKTRKDLFERFKFERVIQPFKDYATSL